jgi:hypothetical protein
MAKVNQMKLFLFWKSYLFVNLRVGGKVTTEKMYQLGVLPAWVKKQVFGILEKHFGRLGISTLM